MQLVMYLGNDFIASVDINTELIALPGYMGGLKRRLMEENSPALQGAKAKPEFLVVNLSSQTKSQQVQKV